MDLITLDANNQPAKLIENWDSLIWTERFNTVGDFQITTGNVDSFMNLLPEGTVVSLRETNVAMIVETHQIDRPKNQPQKLTIKGRSLESVLDRRVSIPAVTANPVDWNVNFKQPSDAAAYVMIVCTGQHGTVPPADPADVFPASFITFAYPADYNTSTGPTRAYTIPRGKLLDTVLQLIQTEAKADATTTPATPVIVPHGIRAIRPSNATTYILVQIYTGVDRSATVYFDATRQLLDDGSYLFSKIGSATSAYVLGASSFKLEKGASTPTGMARRVTLVDATSSGITNADTIKAAGVQSLSEAKETALFDGSINQDINPYKFGTDYGLGDLVKLVGDYGLTKTARVTEYIRSSDATGNKAYPTLVTVS